MFDEFGRELIAGVWAITENSPTIANPNGFKLPLMSFQLASVCAMDKMEKIEYVIGNQTYYSSAYVLSNDLASGKTPTMLGLLAHNPMPINRPTLSMLSSSKTTFGLLTKKFKVVLNPALIFVGANVLKQWEEQIKIFTNMKVFVIGEIASLKKFYSLIYSNDINKYDIILIKNGDTTGKWEWLHNEKDDIVDKKSRKIYNMISVMCRNKCFSRLIIDDFDTIKIPAIAGNINALSTWLISSTKKNTTNKNVSYNVETLNDLIHNSNIVFSDICNNTTLYNIFNVHATSEYIKKCIQIGKPKYFYYLFKQKMLDLLNCMGGDKIDEIMEALNGDAIEDAAKAAGIETKDPNKIFKAILHQNYDCLAEAKRVLLLFETYFDKVNINSLPEPDEEDKYTREDIRNGRHIDYKYPNIKTQLKEEKEKQLEQFNKYSACLDKFRESIKNNECAVCGLELNDPDENYAIMPCCSEILHADCAKRGCNFQKVYIGQNVTISGNCPFNKSHRVLWTDMTYIKNDFDLSQIEPDNILSENIIQNDIVENDIVEIERTKYDVIMDIINGEIPKEQVQIDLNIPKIISGKPFDDPNNSDLLKQLVNKFDKNISKEIMKLLFPNQVLIFSNYNETLIKIEENLIKERITFLRLGGTPKQIAEQVQQFNSKKIQILTINGTEHSGSLNLQSADDLIFAHKIQDPHITQQVAGRIQRPGRKTNARIHWVLFENEIDSLKQLV